jgi:hypothetical protein
MALSSTSLSIDIGNIYVSSSSNAITTMYFCNTSDTTAQFNVYAVPAGAAPDSTKIIYYRVSLAAYDTYVIDTEKLILEDGDRLCANIVDPSSLAIKGLFGSGWGANVVYASMWATDRTEYIIVGDSGKVAISQTGESWEYQPGVTFLGWPDDVKANDITRIPLLKYVMVGDGGWMAASADGINWGYQTALLLTSWGSANINAITNNGSVYVAVGDAGRVATSTNGYIWTVQAGLSMTAWGMANVYTIIWDGQRFLVGGDEGRIATSVDAVTWDYVSSLTTNTSWGVATRITTLVYSGSNAIGYLAVSYDNNKSATSLNGVDWTYDSGLAAVASSTVPGSGGATYKPGFGFYVIGNSSEIYHRDTSGTWTMTNNLKYPPWLGHAGTDIIWNGERAEFIAVGHGARVATSNDGIDWTFRSSGNDENIVMPEVIATVFSIGI